MAFDYVDTAPAGWFVLDLTKAAARRWDWVALISDVPREELGYCPAAKLAWLRIPGRHRSKQAARDAAEDMLATRH